jgi:hypothetical protein
VKATIINEPPEEANEAEDEELKDSEDAI